MGGGQPAPVQYSPQEQALAQISMDNAASQRTRQQAEEDRAREEADRARKMQATSGKVQNMYTQGQGWGAQKASSLGYNDNYGILDSFYRGLDTAKSSVPEAADNVENYFNYDNIWNKSLSDAEGAQKTKLGNEFAGYTKPGWQQEYFADTADDDILNSILGDQYGEAFDKVDAARARGQLSSGAFDNTLRQLDTKKLSARSTLEDMGLGVLGGYRDELGGISDEYSDAISGYKIGQNLNLDDFRGSLDNRAGALRNRMRGDVYRAVGDTSLFNTDALMARGSSAAGVSNNPLRNAFLTGMNNEPERTTGTTGVF